MHARTHPGWLRDFSHSPMRACLPAEEDDDDDAAQLVKYFAGPVGKHARMALHAHWPYA